MRKHGINCFTSEWIDAYHFPAFDGDLDAIAFTALDSNVHHTKNTQMRLHQYTVSVFDTKQVL